MTNITYKERYSEEELKKIRRKIEDKLRKEMNNKEIVSLATLLGIIKPLKEQQ